MQTFTGCDFGGDYVTPFEYVLTGFDGGWMEASQIYRDWYNSVAPAAKPYPAWFEGSPVVVIYPVQGQGTDCGKHQLHPNGYYPSQCISSAITGESNSALSFFRYGSAFR